MDIKAHIEIKEWFKELTCTMSDAVHKAVAMGMPSDLAEQVFEEALNKCTPKCFNVYIRLNDQRGTDALSIEERIVAAVNEDVPYQVVHYKRGEGATRAALNISKSDKRILVVDKNTTFSSWKDGIANKIFIIDSLPEHEVDNWVLLARVHNRIIVVKSV